MECRQQRRGRRLVAAAALGVATTTPCVQAWEKSPINACLWEPTLPSALLREEHANGYGSGRVKWYVLKRRKRILEIKDFFYNLDTDGVDVVCDVIFWQDEDWYDPKDYYTTFSKNRAASAAVTSRIVTGWVSERCFRNDVVYNNYDFVWYPVPGDEYTHLCPLPLGVSDLNAVRAEQPKKLSEFDFLVNYLASLETAAIRQTWYEEALIVVNKLEKQNKRPQMKNAPQKCSFVRAHSKWQEPESYGQQDPDAFQNCTCANLKQCNNSTLGSLTAAQFQSIIRKSAFTFSPPGHNYHSFRTWEAASASSIPVVMDPSKAEDACTRGESYFFSKGPFVYADTPLKALNEMLALAADPTELAARRRKVHQWYDKHMYMGVRRVEASVTAAAAIADVLHGPPHAAGWKKPRYVTEVGSDTRYTSKRNAVALALDAPMADQLLNALRDLWDVQAERDWFEGVRDDGAISVGWAYAGFAETTSPFSKALRETIHRPVSTVHLAPVVLFARDPLKYVPELARLIDTATPEPGSDLALFLRKVAELEPPSSASGKNAVAGARSVRVAAYYWTQWTKRAFELSTFEFHLEEFDPIAALQALGMGRHPALMLAERRLFHLNTTQPALSLSWTQLDAVLDKADLDAMATLSRALGYSTPY